MMKKILDSFLSKTMAVCKKVLKSALGIWKWVLGVCLFVALILVIYLYWKWPWVHADNDYIKDMRDFRDIGLMIFGLLGGGLAVWRTSIAEKNNVIANKNTKINDRNSFTETFSRAIEQLGSRDGENNPNIEVRLGAFFSLEKLSRDNEDYYQAILSVFNSYKRQHQNPEEPMKQDVLTLIQILGRMNEDMVQDMDKDKDINKLHDMLKMRKDMDEGEKNGNKLNDILKDMTKKIHKDTEKNNTFNGANYSDLNLKKANFMGMNLKYSRFMNANLSGANLMGADLTGADLTGADLTGADLTGAGLMDARLRRANLEKADLTGADLIGADLIGADLTGADLRGANLSNANMNPANLTDANLQGANLTNAYLGAVLKNANLRGAINLTWEQLRLCIDHEYSHHDLDLAGCKLKEPDDPVE